MEYFLSAFFPRSIFNHLTSFRKTARGSFKIVQILLNNWLVCQRSAESLVCIKPSNSYFTTDQNLMLKFKPLSSALQ